MMCLQTPGGLLWASSLAIRFGLEGWSTWSTFLITACLQGLLLFLALYFEYLDPGRHSRRESGKVASSNGERTVENEVGHNHGYGQSSSEETPLLRGEG